MNITTLKAGDKVKVVYNMNNSHIVNCAMGKVGTVKSKSCFSFDQHPMVYVEFDKEICYGLPTIGFYADEIEKVNTKNEQLLFDFMYE